MLKCARIFWRCGTIPKKVTVKGIDPLNKKVTIKAEGFLARIFQHEIDHLKVICLLKKQLTYD